MPGSSENNMENFDVFIEQVKEGAKALALKLFEEYKAVAIEESETFLAETKADIERWAKLLVTGALTREDFAWLVKGKKDLLDLHALKQAGLARVRISRFRNGLIKLIVDKAFAVFI